MFIKNKLHGYVGFFCSDNTDSSLLWCGEGINRLELKSDRHPPQTLMLDLFVCGLGVWPCMGMIISIGVSILEHDISRNVSVFFTNNPHHSYANVV